MKKRIPKRKKYIIFQIGIVFIVIYAILVLSVSALSWFSLRVQALYSELDAAYVDATEVSSKLEEYEAIPFLLKYWSEHPEILSSNLSTSKSTEEYLKNLDLSLIESASATQQRTYAIKSYYALSSVLDLIASIEKESLEGPFIVSIPAIGSNTLCYAPSDEYFDIGQTIDFSTVKYAVKNMDFVSKDEIVSRYLISIRSKTGSKEWAIYTPLTYDGKIIGLTIYLVDMNDLRHTSFVLSDAILKASIVLVFAIGLVLVLTLNQVIIKPLFLIQRSLRIYTESLDSDTFLQDISKIKSQNEIGRLADDMNTLVNRLVSYSQEKEHFVSEKVRLDSELALASEIQLSMLPADFPDPEVEKRFELYATMNPAKHVGGDLYDFFFIDDDHLALVIADVSGKGVPAALFMMHATTLIRDKAVTGKAPSEILTEVNNELYAQNKNKLFITTWLLIIELSTGKAFETNAGHEKPVICHQNGKYDFIKNKHNLALGVRSNIKLTDNELQFIPGDKLFIYTDGVTEATNADQQLFGTDRLLASLDQVVDKDQRTILENVKKNIDHFVGQAEQFDDITMLGFTYKSSTRKDSK
ncbi:MAG: hypothetical protein E7309_09520 [Butyrivibrio sp.]|nr:hypothetical protein [Butyrivibrio sp.]